MLAVQLVLVLAEVEQGNISSIHHIQFPLLEDLVLMVHIQLLLVLGEQLPLVLQVDITRLEIQELHQL